MTGVPIAPRRVYGVRLVASAEAGRDSWLCRATPGAGGIRVERVDPVSETPGGAEAREAALRSIAGRILESPASAWGLQFPFGIPETSLWEDPDAADNASLVDGRTGNWRRIDAVLTDMAGSTTAAGNEDATLHLRTAEARRRTDAELQLESPLAPGRINDARHGVRHILLPLTRSARVAIVPQTPLPVLPPGTPAAMAANAASTYVLEVDAAACWRGLRDAAEEPIPARDADAAERESLLRYLVAQGLVRPLSRALRQRIAGSPSALDAVLNAVAAWRGYRLYDHAALHAQRLYRAEGHVYC